MENNGDLLLFLGRWHPLLVHLPIGMLIMAFILALLSRKKAYSSLAPAVSITLLFGATAAVVASVTGYLLSLSGGYDVRTLSLHQWVGISTALVSVLCWLLYRKPVDTRDVFYRIRKGRFAVLGLMLALLGIAGHFGGTLTHGDGYLVEALPAPMRKLIGWQPEVVTIENVQEAAVYAAIIQPIFRQRCQSCHGTKKQEGELALHTFEALIRGGETGQAIVAGDTLGSELYRRLTLPEGDEDRMPPKGRTPISDHQIRLIAWWIDAGAPNDKLVKEMAQPEEIQPILLGLEGGDTKTALGKEPVLTYEDIPPVKQEVVDKLLAKGMTVVPVAENKNQVIVSAINYPAFSDGDAELLLELGANIAQLKLGGTQITDAALKHFGKLAGLRQLHLENTAITDEGIAYLKDCGQLWYLNLVHTGVTDKGIQVLNQIPGLRTLYLYETAVTPNGIAALVQAAPELKIDTGNYQLPALPSDTVVY